MIPDTFGLTQTYDASHLPSLRSTSRIRQSPDPAFKGNTLRKHTQSVATLRLSKVQQEVETDFDELYTTKRKLLMRKAMEVERSESVKDQFQTLESSVVSQIQVYNDLHHACKRKDLILSNLTKASELLTSNESNLVPANQAIQALECRLRSALILLERESFTSETLEKMIIDRKRVLASLNLPIFTLRKELQQLKLWRHDNETEFLRVSLESKSIRHSIQLRESQLTHQEAHHGNRLQDKTNVFKHRSEFVEFVHRQNGQKGLETKIHRNEKELNRLNKEMIQAEAMEGMLERSKTHFERLQEYEKRSESLLRAAHTTDISQVVAFWEHLQELKTTLETSVTASDIRVSELKARVQEAEDDRKKSLFAEGNTMKLTEKTADELMETLREKEGRIERADAKVRNRQLKTWEILISSVKSRLEAVLSQVGQSSEGNIDLTSLLATLETRLSALFPS